MIGFPLYLTGPPDRSIPVNSVDDVHELVVGHQVAEVWLPAPPSLAGRIPKEIKWN